MLCERFKEKNFYVVSVHLSEVKDSAARNVILYEVKILSLLTRSRNVSICTRLTAFDAFPRTADDFSFEHAFAVTANWKRDQVSTIVDDALTHGRRYAPPLVVTIRFRTVVLLFSRKTAKSLKANELQHAGDLPTMAILSRTNSKLDDSVIFRRIPVHARS